MGKLSVAFSNGNVVRYGGKRDVRAAWMITRKSDGKVVADGLSLDTDKARKTAASQPVLRIHDTISNRHVQGHLLARRAGFRSSQEYNDWVKRENAKHAAQYDIEMVAL